MGLTLRPAHWQEAKLFYRWRQQDEGADWYPGPSVTWESHVDWFVRRSGVGAISLVQLFVAELDGVPVGQARVDSNGELSFSIDEARRGKGLGTELVRQATALSGWDRLKANADRANEAGIRTMVAAGFVVRDDVAFLRWPE